MTATAKPHRVQLRRTRGWRMPPNTIAVGRPTKWGNPYGKIVPVHGGNLELVLALFAETARGCWNPSLIPAGWTDAQLAEVYDAHRAWLKRIGGADGVAALRGYNLACWCRLSDSCHADELLRIANR